jgi:hypothetical protein
MPRALRRLGGKGVMDERLSLCGCGMVLCLFGSGSQLRQLIRYGHFNLLGLRLVIEQI